MFPDDFDLSEKQTEKVYKIKDRKIKVKRKKVKLGKKNWIEREKRR